MKEFLDALLLLLGLRGMGSPSTTSGQAFDCVSVRITNGNSAQNDRLF